MLCKHGRSYSEARAFRYIKRFCDDDMRWFRIMFTFFFSAVTALGADCASIPVLSQGPNYDLRSAPVDGGCDWRPTFLFFLFPAPSENRTNRASGSVALLPSAWRRDGGCSRACAGVHETELILPCS